MSPFIHIMCRLMKELIKRAITAGCDWSGLNRVLLGAQGRFCRPYIRALNYHEVPPSQAGGFEAQLRYYARHFVPVGLDDLVALQSGRWRHSRPGLILSFDDGYRWHAEVAGPLLDRYGFTGWFMVPVGFVETTPADQARYAREHHIHYRADELPDDRIAMRWDDLRLLDRRHVICCHTMTHRRLTPSVTGPALEEEILGAKRRLEEELGHAVRAFAWVGGEEWTYSVEAARLIREAGFTASFMSSSARIRPGCDLLQLHRARVEADFPLAFVRLALSGFLDLYYLPRRRRVNRLTAA